MEIIIPIILAAGIFLMIFLAKKKREAIKTKGFYTIGEVIGYENKFMRVAGTWTWLDYPTVKYKDKNGENRTGFIKKAKSGGRFYHVGAKVEIVVHDGTVYARDSL